MTDFPPLKTHQFYTACRKTLGKESLQQIYKKSPTQIYRWGMDPHFCDDWERNPLDRLNVLLERLCELGRDDIARAAVTILAKTVECELSCIIPANPDKTSIETECLDDYPPENSASAANALNFDLFGVKADPPFVGELVEPHQGNHPRSEL